MIVRNLKRCFTFYVYEILQLLTCIITVFILSMTRFTVPAVSQGSTNGNQKLASYQVSNETLSEMIRTLVSVRLTWITSRLRIDGPPFVIYLIRASSQKILRNHQIRLRKGRNSSGARCAEIISLSIDNISLSS